MEVPLRLSRPVVENASALRILTPGAKESTVLWPKLEKLAGLPLLLEAPCRDGVLGTRSVFADSFPAAAKTASKSSSPMATTSSRNSTSDGPDAKDPQLLLITCAP